MWKSLSLLVFCVVFLAHQATSTEPIERLSKEDYARMPPKVHLDRYTHCLCQPNGVYCTVHADVVSDGPSELLDVMRGHAAYDLSHFNHTNLRYGLCMTRHCRKYYNGTSKAELSVAAEACLNDTLEQDYGLKARVTDINCYFEDETKNKYTVDWVDWLVAALMVTIIALNVTGTVYDFTRDQTKPGHKYLLAFSWRINWNQLLALPSSDPRASELLSLNGVRFLTCLFIICIHVPVPPYVAIENPDFIEKTYDSTDFYIMYSGNLTVQSFFLMSGFLLAYNNQVASEKQSLTWKKYFKSIFLRFMRLAPLKYACLLMTATWIRFAGSGPLWQEQSGIEIDHCRKFWLYNFLFVNNFVDNSMCNLQAWSSANDLQLHIIGLTVIFLVTQVKWRRAVMGLLFIAGVAWPAYKIFTMDLDGTVISRPESTTWFYLHDATFHHVYKRTSSNLPVFIVGMTFGYIVYDLQKKKITTQDHSKYRYIYWSLVPILYALLNISGYLYYQPGPRASILTRLVYNPTVKPLFGLTVMLIIFGAVNKVETLYRGVLEWRGFVPLAKLSYSIYTFHMLVVRHVAATRSTLMHYSTLHAATDFFGLLGVIMGLAFVMHMLVEAPTGNLVKIAFASKPPPPAVAPNNRKTK